MIQWLKEKFGRSSSRSSVQSAPPPAAGSSPAAESSMSTSRGSWYHARSARPDMDQVVLTPGVLDFQESGRMLMLTATYLRVYQSFWCSVLVRLDDEDAPALVIKADDSTAALKDHALRIGLSFVRGTSGNLFASFVDSKAPAPERCPFKPLVVFEDIQGLDHEENRDRLRHQLDADRIHVWLAEGGEASVEGGMMSASPIRVHFEATVELEPECRAKLSELLARHFEQHLAIGPARWMPFPCGVQDHFDHVAFPRLRT